MGDLTKNISKDEIKCNCGCGLDRMSRGTLSVVQMVRDHFGKAVRINDANHCGCRCESHNAKVGGSERSEHLPDEDGVCHAIDFHVEDVPNIEVYGYIDGIFPNGLGLGLYNSFVHVDDRLAKARWDLRN